MGPTKAIERFTDAINPTTATEPTTVTKPTNHMVSPTLKNLLATPDVSVQPVTVDPLKRELEIVEVKAYPVTLIETATVSDAVDSNDESKPTKCPTCPSANACPDMSQYIRIDEIPCWNCTLP